MKLTELMRPDFPFRSVLPDYITPMLAPPVVLKPTKPTQEELKNEQAAKRFFGIVKAVVSVILVLILAGLGFSSIGAWLLILPLLVFVWSPKPVGLTATAYAAWFITHIVGVGAFAVGAVGMAVAAIAQSILFQRTDIAAYLLATLFLTLMVVAVVGTLLAKIITPRAAADDEDDEDEDAPAEWIARRLPEVLVDYFAPLSQFPRPSVLRSQFGSDEAYQQALAEANDQREEDRLETARTFLLSVVEDPDTDGAVLAKLRVKDNRDNLVKQTATIDGLLDAHGTTALPNSVEQGSGTVTLRIFVNPVPTPLRVLSATVVDAERFFAENSVTSNDETPLGEAPTGAAFGLPTHHTIVAGRTGAGKGSALQCLLLQWFPLIAAGSRRVWLADPKPAEALPYFNQVTGTATTSVLHRIAVEEDDIAKLIFEFHAEMVKQTKNPTIGRSNSETVTNPGNFLLIDEAASLIDSPIWKVKNDDGLTLGEAMRAVTRKGRSLNFFLYVFTQSNVGKDIYELAKNMPVKLTGYLGTNTLETTRGLDVTEAELKELVDLREVIFPLPKSTKKNGMRYSGIFNYLEEGEAQPIRIPYISEEFIEARVQQFGLTTPSLTAAYSSSETPSARVATPEPKKTEEEDYDDLLSKLS